MKLPLKSLREAKGITQSELSKALKISPSTVGMWEQGRREPDYEMLKRIADFFDVSADYLLGRDSKDNSLSQKQSALLGIFDGLNDEGQNTLMNVLGSLKVSHAKQKVQSVVQKNSGGTNFLATGGSNNYSIVAS